jgi:hypothetical protein
VRDGNEVPGTALILGLLGFVYKESNIESSRYINVIVDSALIIQFVTAPSGMLDRYTAVGAFGSVRIDPGRFNCMVRPAAFWAAGGQ